MSIFHCTFPCGCITVILLLNFNLRRSDHVSDALSSLAGCVFPNAPGPKLPSWYTRCSTAVQRRTMASSLTLPTFQFAEDFSLPAATASFSLRLTVPLLAAERFLLLALRCGTACHRRLRRAVSDNLPHSTRDVPVHWVIISWHSADLTICVYTLFIVDLAVF